MRAGTMLSAAAGVLLVAGAAAGDTLRATYHFQQFTSNPPPVPGAGGAITMNVWELASNQVGFEFLWTGAAYGSMAQIYWDDDASLFSAVPTVTDSGATVAFNVPAANSNNVPAGENISFGDGHPLRANYSITAAPPPSGNGVDALGEFVRAAFAINGSKTIDDVLAALSVGAGNNRQNGRTDSLRVAMHVISMVPGGNSNGFVIVPLPPAAWAGIASLIGLGGFGYIRRRSFRA